MNEITPAELLETLENQNDETEAILSFFESHTHSSCGYCDDLNSELESAGYDSGCFPFVVIYNSFPEAISLDALSKLVSSKFNQIYLEEPGCDISIFRIAFANPKCERPVLDLFLENMDIGGPISYGIRSGEFDKYDSIEIFKEETANWISILRSLEVTNEQDIHRLIKSFHESNNTCLPSVQDSDGNSVRNEGQWENCKTCREILPLSWSF